MNLAALSAIYPGYVQGQQNLAELAQQQEKVATQKRQAIIEAGVGNSLMAPDGPPQGGLGGLSSAPQGAPPAQGPGQPSVPMQPQGQGGLAALAKGPQGAQPPQPGQQSSGPPPGAAPQGGPPQGAPSPPPQQGQPTGPLTVGQMAQKIMAANPQMNFKTPEGARALLGMVERNQQLLAPQAKEELAKISLGMKIDQAQQKLDLGYATLDTRKQIADQADQFRMQIAQMKDDQFKAHAQQQLDELDKKIAAAKDKTDTTEAGKDKRSEAGIASREKINETKLKAVADKAKSGDITDDEAKFYAKALKTDPAIVLRMMGAGGAGTAAKQRISKMFAEDPDNTPEDLAKAETILSGNKAGMQTAARQGAKVDIGAQEIKTLGPQVIAAAKAVDSSKYPTLASLQQAIARGSGDPKVVALNDAITNYRNGLIQVAQRGGATSEGAQSRADKYLSPTMSLPQVIAAIQSGAAEADVAQSAVGTVKGNIANSFGGKPAPAAGGSTSAAPAAGGRVKYDAEGNRIP